MQEFSIVDKMKILMNVIVSSPFYIGLIISLIIILLITIISNKTKNKVNTWIYVGIWAVFFISIVLIYHEFVFDLFDNLIDTIFMALYFPNLATYIIILFISNLFFIYSIFSKKIKKPFKVLNIVNTILIDLLLILIIGVISKNNIDVYQELTVFSNSSLLVLLELSSALFTSWILINLLVSAYYKLKEYDKENTVIKNIQPEIIFDWVES